MVLYLPQLEEALLMCNGNHIVFVKGQGLNSAWLALLELIMTIPWRFIICLFVVEPWDLCLLDPLIGKHVAMFCMGQGIATNNILPGKRLHQLRPPDSIKIVQHRCWKHGAHAPQIFWKGGLKFCHLPPPCPHRPQCTTPIFSIILHC